MLAGAYIDTQGRQTPQDGGDNTVHQGELFAHKKGLLCKNRRYTHDALAQLLGGLFDHVITAGVQDRIDQGTPVFFDAVDIKAALGPGDGIDRQQGRMRKTLVQVLHHHLGFVQHQIPVHQRGQAVVGVEIRQFSRRVQGIRFDHIDGDPFLGQYDTHAVAIVTQIIGEKGHRRPLCHYTHLGFLNSF